METSATPVLRNRSNRVPLDGFGNVHTPQFFLNRFGVFLSCTRVEDQNPIRWLDHAAQQQDLQHDDFDNSILFQVGARPDVCVKFFSRQRMKSSSGYGLGRTHPLELLIR